MHRGHILVVDDEPDLLRALVIRLATAGYRVSTASDGLGAVEAVLAQQPDLVVLDLVMPGLDGYAVLSRLQGLQRATPLPVLCLSARTGEDERRRVEAGGAAAYLAKPYEGAELLAAVARLTAGAAERAAALV